MRRKDNPFIALCETLAARITIFVKFEQTNLSRQRHVLLNPTRMKKLSKAAAIAIFASPDSRTRLIRIVHPTEEKATRSFLDPSGLVPPSSLTTCTARFDTAPGSPGSQVERRSPHIIQLKLLELRQRPLGMVPDPTAKPPRSPVDYLRRYPRICAHIIAESLGYATPRTAANILKDAKEGNENWCEWIYSCYRRDPRPAVERAIRNRHHHEGHMASYELAVTIVRRELETGEGQMFASWF